MKIVVADQMEPEILGALKEFGTVSYFGDIKVADEKRVRVKKELREGATVLVVRSETIVDFELITAAPKLKIIARSGVGLDNIKVMDECRTLGIEVLNTPDAHAINVAEHALYLMLAVAKVNGKVHERTAAGEWPKKTSKPMELYGATLGLVGFGRIGRRLAYLAKTLGMNIIFFDTDKTIEVKFPKTMKYAKRADTLESLLRVSDVVSLHLPENDATRGIINVSTIAKMKDGAILVNTGRGRVIVETDLAAALFIGKLRGAGLDVFAEEPYKCGSLSNIPNVFMTPHIASATKAAQLRCGQEIVKLLRERVGIGEQAVTVLPGRNGTSSATGTSRRPRGVTSG
ncbi:MAG: NAD(P)-dependent oxidoreductase [Candidatus Micrarchaeota archaeon]|nr:NAD(P)-dependent oxidoreductase [Candidatus Micrarchaeota archaeon]